MEIILGITGSTGTIFAVRFLEKIKDVSPKSKIHLIISDWGIRTLQIETQYSLEYLFELCYRKYENNDLSAQISSGSFRTDAMLILPCSMKTMSAIAHGYSDTLIVRAADVCLKERRKLIVCPRETPLNSIHIENMLKLSNMGVHIIPPMPAFYNNPKTLDDMIEHFVVKLLDHLEIFTEYKGRWRGGN
ncbi:MAG: UbiX family flavin prenyltransferase [Chitinispirillales bacterium]|nr:UbiX family flavin prenyltransferase [Chitinispirillales bacterium]